jgi:predicted Zn-dependent protease
MHMQARLRALTAHDAKAAVRYFNAELDAGRDTDANRYGLALALTRARDYAGSERQLNALIVKQPAYPAYQIAAAENTIASGHLKEGLARYQRAAEAFPDNPVLARYYAEALLKAKRAGTARDWARTALRSDEQNPDLYRLLSRAAGDAGHLAEAHQAYAEYYYLNGEPKRALQQLKLARQQPDANSYYQQSIAARIVSIESEIKSGPSTADPSPDGR